jgi:hypothetical protein
MSSDPKLPFPGEHASVETAAERPQEISTGNGAAPRSNDSSPQARSRAGLWLRRAGVLLFVFLCATLGVMLMILPWRTEWSENPLLLSYPTLRQVMASGFARGVVTGLGLLNVWIGFSEALQYQE